MGEKVLWYGKICWRSDWGSISISRPAVSSRSHFNTRSISKRSLSTQALSTQDWLKYRPYERFSAYDGYYLRQANAIFNLLNHPTEGFRKYFQRNHLMEMAILITCHFEDFINNIGLWKALTRKHRELCGYAIPFYDPEEFRMWRRI